MSLALVLLILFIGVPVAIALSMVSNRLATSEPSPLAKRKIEEMDAELDAIDREVAERRTAEKAHPADPQL